MFITRRCCCLLSCCLFLVTSFSTALAVEAPLLWKFNTGDEHHYRMTQNMDMKMSMGAAGEMQTGVKQVMNMTWKVESVDEQGTASITQTIDRVQMDMQAPGQQEMHFDSNSDEAPAGFAVMVAPLFKAMMAEPFKLTMTPRGEITKAEIPESLTEAMKNLPGAAAIGEMFSEDGFKNMLQKSSLVLPEPKDLVEGYQWTTEFEMKNPQFGELAVQATYTYRGTKEVAGEKFDAFDYDLEMEFGEGAAGLEIKVTEQDSQGEILFSREAGALHSSTLKQDMDMEISTAGQNITQKLSQTMMFERVEEKNGE